jgi:hypothetical protein
LFGFELLIYTLSCNQVLYPSLWMNQIHL